MSNNRKISILGVILFGVVILLGEAFKINLGAVKISLSLIVFASTLLLTINKNFKFHFSSLDKLVYVYGIVFLFYTIVGIFLGNAFPDIFEDLYPITVFIILFIVWRSLNINHIEKIWKTVILFGILAAVKVIFISVLPFEVVWDNNWQAAKEPLPFGGYHRIILRGGDIFISFALIYFIIDIHRKTKSNYFRNLIYILITLLAVFISLSRSSYLADGVALMFAFLLFRKYFATRKILTLSSILIMIIIALLPFFNAISLAASIFEARKDAFDANDISVEFRKNERELILGKASSAYYMGNGLGSYFYLPYSGSEKSDGRSIYSHDFNAWLLLKTGIIGLILFYLIFLKSCFNYYWCLRQNVELNKTYHLLLLTLFASGITIYIVSFLANKLSVLSGCVFFAFFAASSVILKRKYESSI